MNYRYYRLKRRSQTRSAKETGKVNSLVNKIDTSLGKRKFSGSDPVLIFNALMALVAEADQLKMSEAQLFLALPKLLRGDARVDFEATQEGTRSSADGVEGWPEAVNYLLQVHAQPHVITSALKDVQEVTQRSDENELEFANRLNLYLSRCGGVHTADECITFYADGLNPAVAPLVQQRREEKPDMRFADIVKFARFCGNAERGRATSRSKSKDLKVKPKKEKSRSLVMDEKKKKKKKKRDSSSSSSAASSSSMGASASGAHVMASDASESDEEEEEESSSDSSSEEEEEALAMEPRFIPAAKVAFDTRPNRPRGWQNSGPPRRNGQLRPPSPVGAGNAQGVTTRFAPLPAPKPVLRTPGPNDSSKASDVTCYTCYEKGHYSPDCTLDPKDHVTVVSNYMKLSLEVQRDVPRISFDNAILQLQLAAEAALTSAGPSSKKG